MYVWRQLRRFDLKIDRGQAGVSDSPIYGRYVPMYVGIVLGAISLLTGM